MHGTRKRYSPNGAVCCELAGTHVTPSHNVELKFVYWLDFAATGTVLLSPFSFKSATLTVQKMHDSEMIFPPQAPANDMLQILDEK